MSGSETNQHDFSKHDKRSDLRTRSDERGTWNWRALVSVGRPKMKWRGGDFESETDQCHHDADREKRLDRNTQEFLSDRRERGRSRHSVDKTDSKKRERAGSAAEQKIFQASFGRTDVALIEGRHHIKR